MSHGQYLFFCDADDYLLPNALDMMIKHAIESHCDLGLFKIDRQDWNSEYGDLFTKPKTNCTFENSSIIRFMGPYKLYSRKLILDNNIRFPLTSYEDISFSTECYFCAKNICVFNDQDYYYYRKRDDGISLSLGGLSKSFDSLDSKYYGVKNLVKVIDKYTTANEQPHAYQRVMELIADRIRYTVAQADILQTEYFRYKKLLSTVYNNKTRALVSISNLFLLDAVMLSSSIQEAKTASQFQHNSCLIVPSFKNAIWSYSFIDTFGTELFTAPFPEAKDMCHSLKNPKLARNTITNVSQMGDNTWHLEGSTLIFTSKSPIKNCELLLKNLSLNATTCIPCLINNKIRTEIFPDVYESHFEWSVDFSVDNLKAIIDSKKNSTLRLFLSLTTSKNECREYRIGKTSTNSAISSFLRSDKALNDILYLPTTTEYNNFSIRVLPKLGISDPDSVIRITNLQWSKNHILKLEGETDIALNKASTSMVCLTNKKGDRCCISELKLKSKPKAERYFQTWSAEISVAELMAHKNSYGKWYLALVVKVNDTENCIIFGRKRPKGTLDSFKEENIIRRGIAIYPTKSKDDFLVLDKKKLSQKWLPFKK